VDYCDKVTRGRTAQSDANRAGSSDVIPVSFDVARTLVAQPNTTANRSRHSRKRRPTYSRPGGLAENFRLGWRGRVQRIGDVDEGPRFVDQESPLTRIIFALGLRCELDGAAAECVGSNGFLIDEQTATHDYRGFSGTVARRASAD
jgi:hypothetical protein